MFDEASPLGRRPRPVAGLPAPAGVALAKAWLLELLAHRALDDIAAVPVTRLAREAPALCEAVVAAVGDDVALERLLPGGDLAELASRAGVLAGAHGPGDVVAAVEALRAVVHRALRPAGDPAVAADMGDRVAHVGAQVLTAALGAAAAAPAPPPAAPATPDEPSPDAAPPPPATPPDPAARILVAQDLRPQPPHLEALDALLAERDAAPFAVLAIEIDDRERLAEIEGQAALGEALTAAEEALAGEARADGLLVRESTGRWWLIAPDTDTDAARRLAHRVATTVTAHAPVRHGVPLRASIGVAVCPDDGTTAQALADHADQGIFTARALGVSVA